MHSVPGWAGMLRDRDRSLRAGNYPQTTRYNYLLAASQLARYLATESPDPDVERAAADPTTITRAHVESFHGWMADCHRHHRGRMPLLT